MAWTDTITHSEFERRFHASLSAGIRLLSPFHDRDLAAFSMRVSPTKLLQGGHYKGLLRPLVKRLLPESGLERQMKTSGHEGFAYEALRQEMDGLWRNVRLATLDEMLVIDSKALNGSPFTEQAQSGTAPLRTLATQFVLLSAERWASAQMV